MQRLTSVILGVAFLSFTASSVYAQSGSRSSAPRSSSSSSSGSSSSGSSSSATGGGGSSSGSGFGSTRSSGRYGLSAAERAAAQRTQAALVNSQINLLRIQAEREFQVGRKAYLEAQQIKQQQQVAHRNELKRNSAALRERNTQIRKQRELENAMILARSTIDWPTVLRKECYAHHRDEIESLSRLCAQLKKNDGAKVGFNASVREFAKQIIKDEQAGELTETHSREVRAFVRALNNNYGQFPRTMKLSDSEMLVNM